MTIGSVVVRCMKRKWTLKVSRGDGIADNVGTG